MARPGLPARAWRWVSAARSHRVLCLLAGLWIINLFDLTLTLIAYQEGLLSEANPLAAFMLKLGPEAVCFFKAVLVASGSAILIRYRGRVVAEIAAVIMLCVYALVAVQWKWCYELYELTHTSGVSGTDVIEVGGWVGELPIP